jgi:hypothetical protein
VRSRYTSKPCCQPAHGQGSYEIATPGNGIGEAQNAVTFESAGKSQRWISPHIADDFGLHGFAKSYDRGLSVAIHVVLILRQKYARKAHDHPGDAGEGQPDSEEPRQESRPVNEQREGKGPIRQSAAKSRIFIVEGVAPQ